MLKITLDTNCLFDYFERNKQATLERLFQLHKEGKIEIAITTRVKTDTYGKDKNSRIWRKIKDWIREYHIKVLPCIGRWEISYWDEDIWSGEKELILDKKLKDIIGSENINDIDHLMAHIRHKRDIFITDDSDFLNVKNALEKKFSIKILTPEDAVSYLRKFFNIAG